MKVLYDISVLGKSIECNRARTGIFRVVESIAAGLVAEPTVEVNFYAMENLQSSYRYLHTHTSFHEALLLDDLSSFHTASCRCSQHKQLHMEVERLKIYIHKAKQTTSSARLPLEISAEMLRFLTRLTRPLRLTLPHMPTTVDIFHSPFLPIPPEVKLSKKVKKFLTIYDLIPLLHPEFFEFREDHFLTKVVKSIDGKTRILTISHSTKNDLCAYIPGLDPDHVTVTHLAASSLFYPVYNQVARSHVLEKYSIPPKPYVLSLSTLEPRKNIDHTIRCFFRLVQEEKIADLNLVLVGSKGWNYDKIFAELARYDFAKEQVIVTGYVSDEDLSALYSGALAFVYPSLYEGFGLPPLEAMKCGVPVITSNTSSLPEVVGDAGILVDPRDADALCAAMLSLYKDSGRREMLARRSLKRASEFSWKRCVNETVRAYKRAL